MENIDNTTNVVKLTNVDINLLKKFLKKSISLGENTLNFEINPQTINSLVATDNTSVYKKWSLLTNTVCEFTENFKPIKVSIFKGSSFVNDLLGYFDKRADIDIYYDRLTNGCIKLFIHNERIDVDILTAPVETSYIEFEDMDDIDSILNTQDVNKFNLSSSDNLELINLSGLDTNTDVQTDYISIYSENGMLIATDNSFKIRLYGFEGGELEPINVDKNLLKFLCKEDYEVSRNTEHNVLLFESKNSDTKTIISLSSEIEDDDSDVDFDFGNDW